MNLKTETGRYGLYQWDTNQILIVEDAPNCQEVHFCHRADPTAIVCSIREVDGKRVVDVPNILLQQDKTITAYLFERAENGTQTRHAWSVLVIGRPKPESYVYTETEVLNYSSLASRIEQLEEKGVSDEQIAAGVEQYMAENPVTPEGIGALPAKQLPEAVNEALAQAKESGKFNGPAGSDYVLTDADKSEIAEMAAEQIEVPGGGIPITGATVGQTVQIAGVDENGVPTAWLPVDLPGRESEWEFIGEINFTEESLGTASFEWTSEKELSHFYITADNVLSNQSMGFRIEINGFSVSTLISYKTDDSKQDFKQVYLDLYGENWRCAYTETAYTSAIKGNDMLTIEPAKTIGKAKNIVIVQSNIEDYQAYSGTIKIWGK